MTPMQGRLIRDIVKSVLKLALLLGLIVSAASPVLQAQREKLPAEDLEFVEKT